MAKNEITDFLLQREPILMVNTLDEVSEKECTTSLTIKEDNFFIGDNGMFSEPGLIEHIAQSCSVLVGWNARQRGEEAAIGYIGEVKKCRIEFLPKTGDTLHTHIKFLSEAMGVTLATAETYCNDKLVTSCKLKISL